MSRMNQLRYQLLLIIALLLAALLLFTTTSPAFAGDPDVPNVFESTTFTAFLDYNNNTEQDEGEPSVSHYNAHWEACGKSGIEQITTVDKQLLFTDCATTVYGITMKAQLPTQGNTFGTPVVYIFISEAESTSMNLPITPRFFFNIYLPTVSVLR